MHIFEDDPNAPLEERDPVVLAKLVRHYADIIDRLCVVHRRVNEAMHQQAAAFTAAGTDQGEAMLLILDDIEKVGPGILNSSSPTKQ